MNKNKLVHATVAFIAVAVAGSGQSPDHPSIMVHGKIWTPASVFARNMGTQEDQVMAEDAPALKELKPGGKEHTIDKLLKDGDILKLGATTLTAHLTPGHTRGCTTWTMKAKEAGKTYDVVFHCSLRVSGQNASKPI